MRRLKNSIIKKYIIKSDTPSHNFKKIRSKTVFEFALQI